MHAIGTPDSSKVTFAGSNATLVLDQTATFSGTVAGFGAQNHIDLPSIAFGAPTTLGYTENSTNTGGTLTISDGSHAASIANYIARASSPRAMGMAARWSRRLHRWINNPSWRNRTLEQSPSSAGVFERPFSLRVYTPAAAIFD